VPNEADLGGGVIKQRIARAGQGKSGGYRTIIVYARERRAFFVYGFTKQERDNINEHEEAQFRKVARYLLTLTEEHLAELLRNGQFTEVNIDDEEIPQ
jgi:hypothetical protein